jgi:hypothetical protein
VSWLIAGFYPAQAQAAEGLVSLIRKVAASPLTG